MINNKTKTSKDYDDYYDYPTNHSNQKRQKEKTVSKEEIERNANELISKPVDYKDILGFISEDSVGRKVYNKFDRLSNIYVRYIYDNKKPKIVTSKISSIRDFNGEKAVNYFSESDQ